MKSTVMFQALDHVESATCVGCEKQDKECLVIETTEYVGPHCIRCVMREARKRKRNGKKQEAGLFDGDKK